MDDDARRDLEFTIAFALMKAFARVHGLRRQVSEADRAVIARHVADHLALANWRIERGPLRPLHGPIDRSAG